MTIIVLIIFSELLDFKTRRVAAFKKNLIELTELEIKHAKVNFLISYICSLKPCRQSIIMYLRYVHSRTRSCSRSVCPYFGKSDLIFMLPWTNLGALRTVCR